MGERFSSYLLGLVSFGEDVKTKQMLAFSAPVPRDNKKIEQCAADMSMKY